MDAAKILEAIDAAKKCIEQDRVCLADSHMQHDNTLDEEGAAGVAEYDAVLAKLAAARDILTGIKEAA